MLKETAVPVLLAFDESQALFGTGIQVNVDAPFSLMDWSDHLARGGIFVTATADSPYRRSLRAGHERYILHVGPLADDEVLSWFSSPQFAGIADHPDFSQDCIPEIRNLTGDIPRELVLLSSEYGAAQPGITLDKVFRLYTEARLSAYEMRYKAFAKENAVVVLVLLHSLVKFFVQIEVRSSDIPMEFLDTGLAYISEECVKPLNANAVKVFLKILKQSSAIALEKEFIHDLLNLKSDNYGHVGLAFEKLFALNMLSADGPIHLKYTDLAGNQEQRIINIRHFITLSADKPRTSWKDYPAGTLLAHSADGEARLDFIFFGGEACILFFEVTVSQDVSKEKYPKLSNDDRLDLILKSMGKWMGGTVRVSDQKTLLPPRNFKGVLEYIVVSSRISSEGNLNVGPMKEEFPWLKKMTRNDLESFFPKSQIDSICDSMNMG